MPYQMSNGKWRAERMICGQRKTRVFATKKEAKAWEAAQTSESWQPRETIPMVCWLDFLNAYLKMAEERFSHKTFNEKRLAARQSLRVIPPEMDTRKIEAKHGLAIMRIAARTSGYAANKTRKNLSAAWEWGKRYYGLPAHNPFLETERFPANQSPRAVPSEHDFWKVYAVADSADKLFLLFLLHTGARVGEVFRLSWADVDLEQSRVRLGTRKTVDGGMKYAWLPLTSDLRAALEEYRRKRPFGNGAVFVQKRNGEPYRSRQHMMPLLCQKAGVKPFGFHGIRHLSATILAYAGLDLPTIQAMLRHSSPTTTARYIKTLGIDKGRIDEAFKRKGANIQQFAPAKKAIST